jgi:small ligand-binding sensory domain FIST
LRAQLLAPRVSLGLIFIHPKLFPHAAQILELARLHAQTPLLVGCSSTGLIAASEEAEDVPGLALGLYYLPGAELRAFHFTQEDIEAAAEPEYWPRKFGVGKEQTNAWLCFMDPFHLDSEAWLESWNKSYAPLPILGGLASGNYTEQLTQVYLDGHVYEEGGIAISIGGDVTLEGVISQGCTPIGDTWTITKAERNFIYEIGNRPAYQVLANMVSELPVVEQQKCRGNLFVGLVMDEYREEFHRGDFLIRNLIGADPKSGLLAVAAFPRAGQTLQFQRRDAAASTEDISALLRQTHERLGTRSVYGGCLCCCNGRGARLFGQPSHDARHVQGEFGPFGLAGFFCNGEIGPVGGKSFLHGYTAALALFVQKKTNA